MQIGKLNVSILVLPSLIDRFDELNQNPIIYSVLVGSLSPKSIEHVQYFDIFI